MRPKGKLFALFAVFAAIGLVTASGAFTTVQADRTAEVDVAGDANALLALSPGQDSGSNSSNADAYVAQNGGNGTIEISLNGDFSDESPSGINNNATTVVNQLIEVQNQGSQTIHLRVETSGPNANVVDFYQGDATGSSPAGKNITDGSGKVVSISPGTSKTIAMKMNTSRASLDPQEEILNDVTFIATEEDPTSP
jgi:hypothetical protein